MVILSWFSFTWKYSSVQHIILALCLNFNPRVSNSNEIVCKTLKECFRENIEQLVVVLIWLTDNIIRRNIEAVTFNDAEAIRSKIDKNPF